MRLWHGGVPGLKPGALLVPQPADKGDHLVDGCPVCAARAAGEPLPGDDLDPTLVYVTSDREYARIYAAGYPLGALYQVEPVGDLIESPSDDGAPTWGCKAARVQVVYDACVRLTAGQARRLNRRYS